MAHITIADLKKRLADAKLIQLTDFDQKGHADQEIVCAAIAAAGGLVDSYCASRYSLPLTKSGQLVDLELTIAVYKLYEGRQVVPDNVRQSYEYAVSFLRDVSTGRASLDQAGITQTTTGGEVITRDHDDDPYVFDNTKLSEW